MEQPVKFNNKEIPSFVRVTGRTVSVLPPVSLVSQEVPRTIGRIHSRVKVEPREYKLDIVIEQNNQWDLDNQMDILGDWLRGDSFAPSPLTFKEQPDRFVLAVVSGSTDINDLFVAGEGSITFIADNPVKSLYETATVEGFGSITVDYKGTVEHRALIELTLTRDCSKIEFKSDRDSKVIILHGQFKKGQKLAVDCQKKLIKLDGIVNMRLLDLSSDWFHLKEGKNKITVLIDGLGMPELPALDAGRNLFRGYPSNSPLRVTKTSYYYQYPFTANGNRIVLKPNTDYIFTWTFSGISGDAGSMSVGYANDSVDFALDIGQTASSAGMYRFRTPAVLPHPYLGIRFNRTGTPSNSVADYWDLAIREGTAKKPWTPAPEDPKVIVSDFKNKTPDNTVGNPNEHRRSNVNALQPPTGIWGNPNQAHYDGLMKLDGILSSMTWGSGGQRAQALFSWNILEIVIREYPVLKGINVIKLKELVKGFTFNNYARGTGLSGNLLVASIWSPSGGAWSSWNDNKTETIVNVHCKYNNSSIITADGMSHILLNADPSNGTTASSVAVDYASVEIYLDLFSQTMPITVTHSTAFY